MSLGPPVCVPCKRVLDMYAKEAKQPNHLWWYCSKCGRYETHENGVQQRNKDFAHLANLSLEEQEEFLKNK